MASDLDARAADDAPPRRRALDWLAVGAFAWLVYETSANPAFAALAACAHFAFPDCRTALWLARRDPDRVRGWCCLWLYAAAGLWKAAVIGVVFVAAMGFLWVNFPQLGGARQPAAQSAVAAAILGFLTSAGAICVAVVSAKLAGRKLWLSSAVTAGRRHGFWPPTVGRSNQAGRVLWTAAGVIGLIGVVSFGKAGVPCLALTSFPAVMLAASTLARTTLADHPEECWPEPPEPLLDPEHGES